MNTNVNIDELIQKMSDFLKGEAKTETIIGTSFKLGEYDCVPVMRVGFGMGGGGGEGKDDMGQGGTGGGVGGGIGMEPVGFLVSRGDQINFLAAKHGVLATALEKLPEVMDKFFKSTKKTEPVA